MRTKIHRTLFLIVQTADFFIYDDGFFRFKRFKNTIKQKPTPLEGRSQGDRREADPDISCLPPGRRHIVKYPG